MKKNTLKKVLLTSLVGVTALSLASCGGNGDQTGTGTGGSTPVEPTTPVKPTDPTPTPTPDSKKPFTPENFANGTRSYVAASYDERTEILGILEKYAFDNKLTGLTLFGDGGNVMYHPSVKKGSNSYIPGYGFGVLSEGDIIADLEGEPIQKYKRYLHTYQDTDPKTVNYMDDKGEVVGDLSSYVTGSYFTQVMNEDKDGYDWVGALSPQDRPIAMNAENGLATKYRIEVKVGKDLKYNTLSKKYAKFNNREVVLDDYLTPFYIMFTQKHGLKRSADNLNGAGSIKGSNLFYEATKDKLPTDELKKQLGIKGVTENGKTFLEFEFNIPCNTFYAMYYLSSGLHAPVPAEFIEAIGNGNFEEGVKAWGKFTNSGDTPVDTWLSTGPYTLSSWEKDKLITFDKNPNYFDAPNRYKIKGIHMAILPGTKDDIHLGFNEFLKNKLHSHGIPFDMLKDYKDDPRTTMTTDSNTTKLNLNTCTPEMWEKLFGENGTITRTEKSKYWECEPAMANKDFINGLNYAINRNQLAATLGRTPTSNYFGNSYMSDPENGIIYNNTEAHKNAVKSLLEGTENGYNLEYARASFKKASLKLIEDKVYKPGDTIKIEIAWLFPMQETREHNIIKQYFESAFNSCGGGLKLEVSFWAPTADPLDAYYTKMMVGQFDIAYGGINGNSLNPLNFLEVLKSDNSSTFTLNWGVDTNVVTPEIYYDNMYWSFDSLWQAADQGAYLENGVVHSIVNVDSSTDNVVLNADGTVTVTFGLAFKNVTGASATLSKIVFFAEHTNAEESDYAEVSIKPSDYKHENGKLVMTLSKEIYDKFKTCDRVGVDVYYATDIAKIKSSGISTVYFALPSGK